MDNPTIMLNKETLQATRQRISDHIVFTPIVKTKNCMVASESNNLTLKLESLQIGGSFKIRGALANVFAQLESSQVKGLCAVSAGNHAIAVALAGAITRLPVTVVIPRDATNKARVDRCQALGATVELTENRGLAFQRVQQIAYEQQLTFIHPFDSLSTIAGAASIAAEIVEQTDSEVDVIYAPIGGGGLISGILAYLRSCNHKAKVIGVEPSGAPTMYASIQAKELIEVDGNSVADSLTPPKAGVHCFEICRKYLDDILLVGDSDIVAAGRDLFDQNRLPIEPAGACALAGFKADPDRNKYRCPVVVVSGSNIPLRDLELMFSRHGGRH